MTIALHSLPPRRTRRHRRVGRGHGSGRGTYAGRGIKGQRARTGGRRGIIKRSVKGLLSHLPKKRGFSSPTPAYLGVNIAFLERHFSDEGLITPATLAPLGYSIRGYRGVKVLGTGKLSKKLIVHAHAFSRTAEHAITKAGGTVVRLKASRHGF